MNFSLKRSSNVTFRYKIDLNELIEVKEMKEKIDEMTNAIQGYEGLVARQQVQIRMLEEFANGIIQRSSQLQLDVQNMNKALSSQQESSE